MTRTYILCRTCGAKPVIEHHPGAENPWSCGCPNAEDEQHRATRGGAGAKRWGKSKGGALRVWGRVQTARPRQVISEAMKSEHGPGDEPCPCCFLRGPHQCLVGTESWRRIGECTAVTK